MSENMLAYSPTLGLVESHVAIYKIYILRNPTTEEIFYVGQTKLPLEARLGVHISEKSSNQDKINYIKDILETGQRPLIEAIETIATKCYIDTMAVNEREIYWIRYHKSLGCKLLNKASTAPETKCREYHGYLAAIKRRETSWHYYYCGKTAGGYHVYDEVKLKADGFSMWSKAQPDYKEYETAYKHSYHPFEYDKYRLKVGLPVIERQNYWKNITTTEIFPEQPSWSFEFAKAIPAYKSLKVEMLLEMQIDDCDFEDDELEWDTSDYESSCDDEPDHEDYDNSLFFLTPYVQPELYYVATPNKTVFLNQ